MRIVGHVATWLLAVRFAMAESSVGRASYGATGSPSARSPSSLPPLSAQRGPARAYVAAVAALCLLAAHCIAGFIYYGSSTTMLLSVPAGVLEQGLKEKWVSDLEPSTSQLTHDALAMLRAQRSLDHVKTSYAGVKSAEQQASVLGQGPVALLQKDGTNGVDDLGLDVPSLQHFETAEAKADYYQQRGRYAVKGSAGAKKAKLLEPNTYPQPGYPYDQQTLDTKLSDGPAKTFDTRPGETCPSFIPNCKPQHNTLTRCDFSCGAYCQALRGDGPCFSGDAEGEWADCKFGYRGAAETPSVTDKEESGWLEGKEHWEQGGPTDCMTCPVGFKIKPLYGDGTGRCEPCEEGWVDAETGLITEEGCAGAQYIELAPGEEPGQTEGTEEYATVAGCLSAPDIPPVGSQILAKIPDDEKKTPFFEDYPADYYPAEVEGYDEEEEKLAVQFADGGPFVGYDPGVDATVGEDFVPLPKEGDKVTLSAEYWEECCAEEWDPAVSGPLRLGDVGEVSSVLPPEAGEPAPYTVLAPNGERWMYGAGQVLKLVGEVRCPLPGSVIANTIGAVANKLAEIEGELKPEDAECCCCTRDLWVGCWGWCGDGSTSLPQLPPDAPHFRAGKGSAPLEPSSRPKGNYERESWGGVDPATQAAIEEKEDEGGR